MRYDLHLQDQCDRLLLLLQQFQFREELQDGESGLVFPVYERSTSYDADGAGFTGHDVPAAGVVPFCPEVASLAVNVVRAGSRRTAVYAADRNQNGIVCVVSNQVRWVHAEDGTFFGIKLLPCC